MDANTNLIEKKDAVSEMVSGEISDAAINLDETKNLSVSQKGIKIFCLALAAVFGIVTILCSVIIIKGWLNPDRPPSLFGITPAVMADTCMESSMDDAIAYGDILFLKRTDTQTLAVGDVVAFCEEHIIYIGRVQALSRTESDVICTVKADRLPAIYPYAVTNENLVGSVGLQISGLGRFALFVITPLGTFLCCWGPAAICIAIILYEWLKIRKEAKCADDEEETNDGDFEETDSVPNETNEKGVE